MKKVILGIAIIALAFGSATAKEKKVKVQKILTVLKWPF